MIEVAVIILISVVAFLLVVLLVIGVGGAVIVRERDALRVKLKAVRGDNVEEEEIHAGDLRQGDVFRKRTGKYAYLRISDSAVEYYGLKSQGTIFGVCFNGNMTEIAIETIVVRVPMSCMLENLAGSMKWKEEFAGRGEG